MAVQTRPLPEGDFNHFSIHNAVRAELGCPTAECRAYVEILTFKRWLAKGFVVRKGEHGIKITTWIPIVETDDQGNRVVKGKRPKTVTVFCRHQVEQK
jgi:antirestriction protein ArdC